MPSGGHFAATEEPLLLAKDIWQFLEALSDRNQEQQRRKEF